MRRVVGALIVVVLLGGRHVPGAFERSLVPAPQPRETAGVVPPADSPPTVPPVRPAESAAPRAAAPPPGSFRDAPLAFLSRAPADSLDLLPGVGPVLASRIADARRERGSFASWDDVLAVRGIGPKTIERWKALAGRGTDRP